jgi:hypothetical protein
MVGRQQIATALLTENLLLGPALSRKGMEARMRAFLIAGLALALSGHGSLKGNPPISRLALSEHNLLRLHS